MYECEHEHTICERHVVKEINYKKFVKKEDYFNSIPIKSREQVIEEIKRKFKDHKEFSKYINTY